MHQCRQEVLVLSEEGCSNNQRRKFGGLFTAFVPNRPSTIPHWETSLLAKPQVGELQVL